jgi:hypothetical protein
MEKRDLKDYIVKLNDRNIQRQRESGFTLYAIGAAVIYCVFYLIDNIKIAYYFDLQENLKVAVFTANLLFIISLLHIAYLSTIDRTLVAKIFPYQEPLSFDMGDLSLIISYALISMLNIYVYSKYFDTTFIIFLLVFAVIPLLNAISPIVITIYKHVRKLIRKKKNQSSEAIDYTVNYNLAKKMGIGLVIYSSALTILYVFTWKSTYFDTEPQTMSEIIKFTVCCFSLLYLLNIAIEIHSKQNYNHLLEEFEKEIFYENIDNDEIAKRSELLFFGIPIKRWLEGKEREIAAFFDDRRKESLAQSVRIMSIESLSEQNELDNLIKTIQDRNTESIRIAKDYVQKINRNFSDLNQFAHLDKDEEKQLNDIILSLNLKIRDYNKRYRQQLNALQRQIGNFYNRKS